MSHNIPDDQLEQLRQATKQNAEMISQSACFVCLFSEKMIEEVIPIIQMGLAVYEDKPIVLLVPQGMSIPKNLRRMAEAIEHFIPGNQKSVEDAHSTFDDLSRGKGAHRMKTEETYDANGCPCPKCGNDIEAKDGVIFWTKEDQPIFNAVRQYPGIEIEEFPGYAVNDVGWRCGFCGWEYGFDFSEPSAKGDQVQMKPVPVVMEIPREMLATLRKLWLLWEPEVPRDVGSLLNHIVNCICEGANDPDGWQRVWLHLAGIFVEGEDPENVDDVSVIQKTALRHPVPPQPKEGGKNDG